MRGWPWSLRALQFYPKKHGSCAIGWLARRRIPRALREPLIGTFARIFGANVAEADKPLDGYESIQAFFTRRLAPGTRPQSPPSKLALNSPVDGRLIQCARIEKGLAIQAKGLPYRVAELLGGVDASRFDGGWYLTLYLAPKDYHRIHVPCWGRVIDVGRVEGELWPVNDISTAHVPLLYERNRRATWIAIGSGCDEGLDIAVVLVGATHVGGCVIDARWLGDRALEGTSSLTVDGLPCAPGDDLGVFEFGSTVVLLIGGPRSADWAPTREGGDVKVGERLGGTG